MQGRGAGSYPPGVTVGKDIYSGHYPPPPFLGGTFEEKKKKGRKEGNTSKKKGKNPFFFSLFFFLIRPLYDSQKSPAPTKQGRIKKISGGKDFSGWPQYLLLNAGERWSSFFSHDLFFRRFIYLGQESEWLSGTRRPQVGPVLSH